MSRRLKRLGNGIPSLYSDTHLSPLFKAMILARLSIKPSYHLVNKADILEVFILINALLVTESWDKGNHFGKARIKVLTNVFKFSKPPYF